LLIGESRDCDVEAIFPYEGTCSAASVAQNEKSLNSAIANQTQGQVQQGNSASLLEENQVFGVEVKGCYKGTGSAASVPSVEKWSHEAIVARSNVRPVRGCLKSVRLSLKCNLQKQTRILEPHYLVQLLG
jgi:hypothetical protein